MEKVWYTSEEIENKIKQILVEKLGQDESDLTSETNLFDDLGLDSLDLVELILYVEKDFNIVIDDSDVEKIKTIGEAAETTKKVLDKK